MSRSHKNEKPKLAGVIGWPIGQSLSPLIHTIWAKRAGINGYYIPLAVVPDFEAFARTMDSLRTVGFAGVNVTLPHKEHALRYAEAASEAARAAGAANMLSFGKNETHADNSDVAGFAAAVCEQSDHLGKSALILGAGGAARGISMALKQLGFTEIQIANRTREKADMLAAKFDLNAIDWNDRTGALAGADMLVNTTSLGMSGQPPLEISLDALKPTALVADIVYAPLETSLLKAASAKGHKTIDGLAMLMHQAVPGFETWLGGNAVVDDALRSHLVNELQRRAST